MEIEDVGYLLSNMKDYINMCSLQFLTSKIECIKYK